MNNETRDDLHDERGEHRSPALTANGRDLENHERRILAHMADGHTHVCADEVEGWDEGKQRRDDAVQFTADLLADLKSHRIGDGYTYDSQKVRAESFMVAGSGPGAWVWFVYDVDGDIDHCYVEYCDFNGRALVPVPKVLWGNLHYQLTRDQEAQK